MPDFSTMALGCLPPYPADKSKRVPFASVFGPNLPKASPARDWTDGATMRPCFGNDKAGNCTIASIANIVIGSLKESFGNDWYPTTGDVLSLYYNLTGGRDSGLVLEDVLKYIMKNGAFGSHFAGTAAIAAGDVENIKLAIDWFGSVDLGVALPAAWKRADEWTMNGYFPLHKEWSPGSWGRGCYCSEKYDVESLYVWAWGEIIPCSWDAVRSYAETADAVLPVSWVNRGRSPANIDLSILEARMMEFTA